MAGLKLGSLRTRLVLLVLLGALPALGLTFYSGLEERHQAMADVRQEVLALARHASEMQRRHLAEARQTLFTLCQLPQLHDRDAARTESVLKRVLKNSGMFSAFLATRPDGLVFASAPHHRKKIDLGDRPYFKRLRKTGQFVVGHFIIGRITGRPVLSLAYPVKDPGQKLQAVLVTGLKLDWVDRFFTGLNLPPGTQLSVIDRNGRLLVHLPERPGLVGRNIKDRAIVRMVLKRGEGVVQAADLEGQRRLFAFASLSQGGGVYILIGVSIEKAFASVTAKTIRNMSFLGLVFLLALLAAWFGGTALIGRPVNKILGAMGRVSAGDFTARAEGVSGSGELGRLAQGFDQMVEMLAVREEALKRQSEATYQAIFNAVEEAVFVHDPADGHIIDVNRKVEDMFGYTPDEARRLTVAELGAGDEPHAQADAVEWIQKAVQEGTRVIEWQCRRKDGSRFWAELSLKMAKIAGEQRILAVMRDIDDRKRAEEALRESEEKFRSIAEATSDWLWEVDHEGKYTYSSPKVKELLGHEPEEIIGRTPFDLMPPEEADRMTAVFMEMVEARRPFVGLENQNNHLDGRQVILESSGVPFFDADGNLMGYRGVDRDITARKEAQSALDFERAQLLALFEGIDDVMYVSDPETYELLYVNPAMRQTWGDDVIGRKCYFALQGRDAPCPFCTNDIILGEKLGQTHVWEFQNEVTGGWYRCADKAIKWADGRMVRFEIASDISARKEMEQERAEIMEELEGKNAELERFTYTVSHDLKSPLITVKGFLGFLEQDAASGDADRLQHDIRRISGAVEKMARLLEELLELSRIGRLMNPPEDVSLSALSREAGEMLHGLLDQGGIELVIQPDLPVVHGDRIRLREVVENLMSNAAKFMGDQVEPRIEIGVRNERDAPVFFVQDNGIGIEPQYHAKVFDLFEQLKPGGEGTGIGLALVKRIVEVHGGRIWVESEGDGQGTTFLFTLPLKAEHTATEG